MSSSVKTLEFLESLVYPDSRKCSSLDPNVLNVEVKYADASTSIGSEGKAISQFTFFLFFLVPS